MIARYLRFALLSCLAGATAYALTRARMSERAGVEPVVVVTPTGTSWFERARPHCNAVEVAAWMRQDPPSRDTWDGVAWAAACLALAGKTDSARVLLQGLSPDERVPALSVVFDVGHPVADMGDDLAAAPIMELVVRFWPNHYMARYHAGASAYQLGHYARATQHLEAFLESYKANDGWTGAARGMLQRMREAPRDPPRPVEDPHP